MGGGGVGRGGKPLGGGTGERRDLGNRSRFFGKRSSSQPSIVKGKDLSTKGGKSIKKHVLGVRKKKGGREGGELEAAREKLKGGESHALSSKPFFAPPQGKEKDRKMKKFLRKGVEKRSSYTNWPH